MSRRWPLLRLGKRRPAAALIGVMLLLGLARVAQRTAWMLILSGLVLIAVHTIVLLAGRLVHS